MGHECLHAIIIAMSKMFEDAIKKVRVLPEAEQDEAAELLMFDRNVAIPELAATAGERP